MFYRLFFKNDGVWRVDLTKEELIATTLIGKKKQLTFSFLNCIHFTNGSSLKEFMTTHWDTITKNVENIHPIVYGTSEGLSLPECAKKGENRFLKLRSNNSSTLAPMPSIEMEPV